MAISETKMQMVIDNYFKDECDVNTSIRQAFEKGFRIGVKKGTSTDRPQGWIPCSERLPEEHEWVGTKQFGTTISDIVHITFDVNGERFVKTLSLQNGELSNYEKRSMDAFYKGWKMLAWMPLPEPWEGADDDIT